VEVSFITLSPGKGSGFVGVVRPFSFVIYLCPIPTILLALWYMSVGCCFGGSSIQRAGAVVYRDLHHCPITASVTLAPVSYDDANQQADDGASCAAVVSKVFVWKFS